MKRALTAYVCLIVFLGVAMSVIQVAVALMRGTP